MAAVEGLRNPAPTMVERRSVAVFGVVLALASDLMLFAGFFSAYFLLRSRTEVWPPATVHLDTLGAAAGTVLLVASSVTVWKAQRALRAGDLVRTQRWLGSTILLGIGFALNQLRDYRSIGFQPSDHAYGGIYWTLTGLHGVHVLVGIIALAVLSWRVSRAPAASTTAFEATALYWHLVDAVWLALFTTVWVIR
ncbi:MAG: cytochrome c oxidase subunit 3 [Ilumatobacteraceae bacterium]